MINSIQVLRRLALMVLFGMLSEPTNAANPNAPAAFSIHSTPIAGPVTRIGANFNNPYFNNWVLDSGMEPFVANLYGVATGGSATEIENDGTTDTSFDGAFADGFFNGAEVRVYRIDPNGQVNRIRIDTVANYYASAENGYRMVLSGSGANIQAGDHYFLRMIADNVPANSVGPSAALPVGDYDSWFPYGPVTVFRDAAHVAPEHGGTTSLRMSMSSQGHGGILQGRYGAPSQLQESLLPGRSYRMEAWIRQEGLAHGRVHMGIDTEQFQLLETFEGLNGDWRFCSYEFVMPDYPAPSPMLTPHSFLFEGPGSVWVDNVRLYEVGTDPFAIQSQKLQALQSFRPGTLRLWAGHSNEQLGTTLDDWTNREGIALRQYHPEYGAQFPDMNYKLPTAMELCETVGADPWLIVGPYFSEEEWSGLVDYLAGDGSSVYGAKRIAQGRVNPYTDSVEHIFIEIGNETWNPEYLWGFDPVVYGQFAEHFFSAARNSPSFAAVAHKFVFIINGWIADPFQNDFGQLAKQQSPSTDAVSVAAYHGGWEIGVRFGGNAVTDEGFEDLLEFSATHIEPLINQHAETRYELEQQGIPYSLYVYEGGPGYFPPNQQAPLDPIMEAYGKSLAGGVAALDTYLHYLTRGFERMNFFNFSEGADYASHSMTAFGFQPYPVWMGLQLFNDHVSGNPVFVSQHEVPSTTFAGTAELAAISELPLTRVHAFQEGDRYSVIVLSRKLHGDTPVTLSLPFITAQSVTRYAIVGDPQANNLYSQEIQQVQESLSGFNQEFSLLAPPASIQLYLFEGVQFAGQTAPSVVINRNIEQALISSEMWLTYDVTFDQPVTGLDESDFDVQGVPDAWVAAVWEAFPFDGSTFGVGVTGMPNSGDVALELRAGTVQSGANIDNSVSSFIGPWVTFNRPLFPGLISPVIGSVWSEGANSFAWTQGDFQVDEWILDVGTVPDGSDLFTDWYAGGISQVTVDTIPNSGIPIYVSLAYRIGDFWDAEEYVFTATAAIVDPNVLIDAPVSGSVLTGTSVSFDWEDTNGLVEEWYFDVGSVVDGSDFFTGNYQGNEGSALVTGLPNDGSPVYVRWNYRIGWDWFYIDRTYTAQTSW